MTNFVFQQFEKVKQDDSLSDLSNLLGQLKEMAVDMGSEIERFTIRILTKFNSIFQLISENFSFLQRTELQFYQS